MLETLCYFFVFVAEALIAWLYFDQIFPEKRTTPRIIAISFTIGYLILFLLSNLKNVLINGICFWVVNAAILYISFHSTLISGILHVGYMNIAMFGTELIVALVLSRLTADFSAYLYQIEITIAFSVLSRLIYFAVMQVGAKIFRKNHDSLSDYSLSLLAVFPLSSVLIGFAICFVCLTASPSKLTSLLLIIAIFILLLSNIIVMLAYRRVQKINDERLHYAVQVQKEMAKAEYYEMMQEQTNNHRIFIHDIKKHLHVISCLVQENKYDELNEYIDSFSISSVFYDSKLSEEPVMNSILSRYRKLCQEKNVDCDFDVRHDTISFMHKGDITSLFDNLLSNAYEAALNSDEHYIRLAVIRENENTILIKLVNSCENEPVRNAEGRYVSSKKDKFSHGLGLRSIEKCVKKYNGQISMTYDKREKTFTSIIMMDVQSSR